MILFPFIHRLNVGKFDVVFVDEAQDLNAAQIAMVLSAHKIDGRIIAVGDPAQSIYQFRGADSEAIPNFISKLNAKTLPLSVSYRCPKSVIRLAQEVVPDIQAAPDAKEGVVEEVLTEQILKLVKPGDFVLSRTNAPLIKLCLKLLKAGIPANIQGRDIGSNLLYFIKKSKAKTINSFIEYVNEWKAIEVKRLVSEKRDTTIVLDKAECLLNLCEGTLTIKDLKESIDTLFSDINDNAKVVFSTTHKAKGLERDRVFVLADTYRFGNGGEEDNLWYVATTRSKSELYLVRKVNKWEQYDETHISKI
jgi:superfamily I DNA/RNA helicase